MIMTTKTAILSVTLSLATIFGLQTNGPVYAQADSSKSALDALTPGFWKLFDRKAQLTKVGSGFGFTEGPVWDPAGYLWISDETLIKYLS